MTEIISKENALPGRDNEIDISGTHVFLQSAMKGPFENTLNTIIFGMGCFWGVEKLFWTIDGVFTTAAGYAGGHTANPTYKEVCSEKTGHTEAVLLVYDPQRISVDNLLVMFWESHNPTQGMRQGNDIGTQYRSAIYVNNDHEYNNAISSMENYKQKLGFAGFPDITTEIKQSQDFFYAEEYHQQYLFKNPNGYCGLSGTGVMF